MCAAPRHCGGPARGRKNHGSGRRHRPGSVYQVARDFGNAEVLPAPAVQSACTFSTRCRQIAEVHVATDDGSAGYHGGDRVLRERLQGMTAAERQQLVFCNCGPQPMVLAAAAVEQQFCRDEQIFSSIDYLTKCGVGICGACASPTAAGCAWTGPSCRRCDAGSEIHLTSLLEPHHGQRHPPLSWEKAFDRLLSPLEEFIHRQTTSGVLLMICAVIALVIANSPCAMSTSIFFTLRLACPLAAPVSRSPFTTGSMRR